MPKEYTWLDKKYVTVPSVIGMNVDDAKDALKGFNIEYTGDGSNVIYQSPQEGYYIEEGATIKLMLSN